MSISFTVLIAGEDDALHLDMSAPEVNMSATTLLELGEVLQHAFADGAGYLSGELPVEEFLALLARWPDGHPDEATHYWLGELLRLANHARRTGGTVISWA